MGSRVAGLLVFLTLLAIFLARFSRVARSFGATGKLGSNATPMDVVMFMDSVKDSLEKEEAVYLRGFGSFILKKRAEKTARNISKNTTVIIPAHNIPAFKPAKAFMADVKNNTK